jgi:hypothetical protein
MPNSIGELSGKTILLHIDQGLGDTIQYVRYVPYLVRQGARVVLESPRELASLLAGLPGMSVLVQGEALPPFDCHFPLISLPAALGNESAAEPPYLEASPSKIARWRSQIRVNDLPHIGLVWAGNSMHKNDRHRSIPLRLFLPLLETPGVQFVALQKQLREGEADTLPLIERLTFLGDRLEDFSDTAAVVSLLDLVITVDTAVGHLAGAMAKSVWFLLSSCPDWRWTLSGTHTPTYPSARLFRQSKAGDWQSVLANVRKALEQVPAN